MKRDMELVRTLLNLIENSDPRSELILPDDLDRNVAAYHLKIMDQAGFTTSNIKYAGNEPLWITSSLTWQGHEFLDSIKNDTIWNKTKAEIKEKGLEIGQVTFSVVMEYAKAEIKKMIGMS